MVGKLCLFALVASAGVALAAPQDGVLYSTVGGKGSYGTAIHWTGGVIAKDGGVATIHPKYSFYADSLFPQNVAGLKLSGLHFINALFTMTGNDISLTGPEPEVYSGLGDGKVLTLAVGIVGEETNTVVKTGKGAVNFVVPLENFAALYFRDGVITATNSSGRIVADAPIALSKRIDVRPGAAENLASELTLGNGPLVAEGDAAGISLSRGANTSLVVKAESLVLSNRATFALSVASGIGELGGAVKFKLDEAPVQVNGMVDQRIVARDTSVASAPFSFLDYDEDNGFVPAKTVVGLDGGADEIARIDGSCRIEASKEVLGLVIDNNASVTNGSDVTVKIGDDVNPAAMILNNQVGSRSYSKLVGGAFDFGNSPGIIYKAAIASSACTDIYSDIKGSNGVSFVAKSDSSFSPYIRPHTDAGWTGPTYISGLRFWLDISCNIPKPFPDGGDIYVTGGDIARSGQIYFLQNYDGQRDPSTKVTMPPLNQHFHVSGYGCQAGDQDGAIFFVSSSILFNGPFTIYGDTFFNIYETINLDKSVLVFNRPIGGKGDLLIKTTRNGSIPDYLGSSITFNATNTLDGAMTIGPGVDVVMGAAGTFGAGDVVLNDIGLEFAANAAFSVTNGISGSGRMSIAEYSSVSLEGKSEFASVAGAYGSVLEIGSDVSAGEVEFHPGSSVFAADEEAELRVTGGTLNGALSSGDGRSVRIVKHGDGELVLAADSGSVASLDISGGTVRFACPVLEDTGSIEYWLDATDAATLTFDDDGAVTNWASKAGREVNFAAVSDRKAPKLVAGAVNGLNALLFTNGVYQVSEGEWAAKDTNRLKADRETANRTLFIVNVPLNYSPGSKFGGLFGQYGADYGIRMDYGNCWCVPSNGNDKVYFPMLKYMYLNGEKVMAANNKVFWSFNSTQVAAFFHPYNGKGPDVFTASIGGYRTDLFYSGSGTSIYPVDFNGYIAEVIAFNRMLSEKEILEVSDYLGKKWLGQSYTCKLDDETTAVFAGGAVLSLFGDGKLDLSGLDLTVAELSGFGEITNSSERAATLTVSGNCDFSGAVAEGVVLKAAGGKLSVDPSQPAHIVLGGETQTVGPYNYSVPVDGICYWMDASRTSTLTLDDEGYVTNWTSRAEGGEVSRFYWSEDKVTNPKIQGGWIFDPPQYCAQGLNGKPAIKSKDVNHAAVNGEYGRGSALVADAQTDTRTVFMVGSVVAHAYYSAGIFGLYGADTGFRFNNPQNDNALSASGNDCSYMRCGDVFRLNGADGYGGLVGYSKNLVLGEPFVLTAMIECSIDRTGYNSFPGYFINRSPEMYVSEVIAYDRKLSDVEIEEIERYLTAKWLGDDPIPAENDEVFAEGSTITVAAENGEVGKLVVEGDLDLEAVSFRLLDTKTLSSADTRDVVEVKGALAGEIGDVERENAGSWKLTVFGREIRIVKPGFFLLMR